MPKNTKRNIKLLQAKRNNLASQLNKVEKELREIDNLSPKELEGVVDQIWQDISPLALELKNSLRDYKRDLTIPVELNCEIQQFNFQYGPEIAIGLSNEDGFYLELNEDDEVVPEDIKEQIKTTVKLSDEIYNKVKLKLDELEIDEYDDEETIIGILERRIFE